nr:hypothetical protein [Dyadobacter sp. CECT 9623]
MIYTALKGTAVQNQELSLSFAKIARIRHKGDTGYRGEASITVTLIMRLFSYRPRKVSVNGHQVSSNGLLLLYMMPVKAFDVILDKFNPIIIQHSRAYFGHVIFSQYAHSKQNIVFVKLNACFFEWD